MDGDSGIGADKGVQWWTPGSAPKIKVVNRFTHAKSIEGGTRVATAYATNCDGFKRILIFLLKNPPPPPAPAREQQLEEPGPEPGAPDPDVRVGNANTGQLSHTARDGRQGRNQW